MKDLKLFVIAGLLVWSGAVTGLCGQVVPFTDISGASGISTAVGAMSWPFDVAAGDFDNDGYPDLYVTEHDAPASPNLFLHNNGNGSFSRFTTGADNVRMCYTAMICDMNNDGLADIVASDGDVCSYYAINQGGNNFTAGNTLFCTNGHGNAAGDYTMDGYVDFFFDAPGNALYQKNGNGTYTNVYSSLGVSAGSGICPFFVDLNNDDAPDLFRSSVNGVTVMYTRPLINDGSGHLVETDVGLDSCPGTGVALGDIDNDGDLDVFAGGYGSGSTDSFYYKLYRNDGGHFTDITAGSGLPATKVSANMWYTLYYRAVMEDFDNDGYLDIYCPTPDGMKLFRNLHNNTFRDVTDSAGVGRVQERNSSPFAFDCDNDGDMDLFVLGNPSNPSDTKLFRNNLNNRNWLKVRVHGNAGRTILGSKVRVYEHGHLGESAYLKGYREVMASSACKSPLEQHFGLDVTKTYDVQVTYPRLLSGSGRLVCEKLNVATAKILDFYADSGKVGAENRIIPAAGSGISISPDPLRGVVRFQLSTIGKDNISGIYLYDPRGKLISKLKPDYQDPTTIHYTWNIGCCSSRFCIARLQSGDKVYTRRLMIMK